MSRKITIILTSNYNILIDKKKGILSYYPFSSFRIQLSHKGLSLIIFYICFILGKPPPHLSPKYFLFIFSCESQSKHGPFPHLGSVIRTESTKTSKRRWESIVTLTKNQCYYYVQIHRSLCLLFSSFIEVQSSESLFVLIVKPKSC